MWSGEDGLGYDVNPVLNHYVIVEAAVATDVPTSTYVLRWAMENDVIVIPCSKNSFHLELNMAARYVATYTMSNCCLNYIIKLTRFP